MKFSLRFILVLVIFIGCNSSKKTADSNSETAEETQTKMLSKETQKIRDYLSNDLVIAHRGSPYWAPEESEPAYRLARNLGADYLELDMQMTKDSILVAIHDNSMARTTDVGEKFPDMEDPVTDNFTLKELRSFDIGSWYNETYARGRDSYVGLTILTLKDVLMIAEGYHIKKDENGEPVKEIVNGEWNGKYSYEEDPFDNKNRPGVYAETKKLGLEKLLAAELKEHGWLISDNPKKIKTYKNKVGYADTKARFVLQTFYRRSIEELNVYLPELPKGLLIWEPRMSDDIRANYLETINYCVENDVAVMGASLSGGNRNYGELSAPWMVELVHEAGMLIHSYTVDGQEQLDTYGERLDGLFTNRTDLTLEYYNRKSEKTAEEILSEMGY